MLFVVSAVGVWVESVRRARASRLRVGDARATRGLLSGLSVVATIAMRTVVLLSNSFAELATRLYL